MINIIRFTIIRSYLVQAFIRYCPLALDSCNFGTLNYLSLSSLVQRKGHGYINTIIGKICAGSVICYNLNR